MLVEIFNAVLNAEEISHLNITKSDSTASVRIIMKGGATIGFYNSGDIYHSPSSEKQMHYKAADKRYTELIEELKKQGCFSPKKNYAAIL